MPTRDRGKRPSEQSYGPSLDDFLNSKSNYNLQQIAAFWADRPMPWHSKMQLIRELRKTMLDPAVVRAKLSEMSTGCRMLLRRILKGNAIRPDMFGEWRHAERLGNIGFLDPTYVIAAAGKLDIARRAIPQQLAEIAFEALMIDTRDPADVIMLRSFLETLPDAAATARKWIDAAAEAPAQICERLLEPASIQRRMDSLPRKLAQQVIQAVDEQGGIMEAAGISGYEPSEARQLLEQSLLGTVTELPDIFSNIHNPMMLVFIDVGEVILLQESNSDWPESADADRGIAALADINTILRHLSLDGVRIKQDGDFYKSSLRRLVGLLPPQPSDELAEEMAGHYAEVLGRQGLTLERGNLLIAGDAAEEWFKKTPTEQIRNVLNRQTTNLRGHQHHIWQEVLAAAAKLPPDTRIDAMNLLSLAIIVAIRQAVYAGDATAVANESYEDFVALGLECLHGLHHYGALAAYGSGYDIRVIRLTPIGAAALGVQWPQDDTSDERLLIVNPDFECIVFRHGPAWRIAAHLSAFARRSKTDQTYHFKITREEVQTAILCGEKADDIVAFLKDHSRTPVPQNVEYSIRDWASGVKLAKASQQIVLDVRDKETLDIITADAALGGLVVRRVSPTTAIVDERFTARKATERLRELGIFVRLQP